MLLFRKEDRSRVASGEISVSFRLWKSPHVKAGKRYATGFGTVEIHDVRVIPAALVEADDVRRTGCEDMAAVWALAGDHTSSIVTGETPLHRIEFRYLGDVPASSPVGVPVEDTGAVVARLRKLDERATGGPWTLATLQLIEAAPGVPARVLAAELGREKLVFKADVRKLKALGLTISHEIGYGLSELGRRVLERSATAGD